MLPAVALPALALALVSVSPGPMIGPDRPGRQPAPAGELVLEGEALDLVLWRLFDAEFRRDRNYLDALGRIGPDERTAILVHNHDDLVEMLAESRGGRHRDVHAAVDSFRPFARWLKDRVLGDPIGYLRGHGAFTVGDRDVREWSDLFVDAFSDEDHVREALDAMEPATARRLYAELPDAARAELERVRGREYPSLGDKKADLRRRLFALRDRIAVDPESWLRGRIGG